MKQEYARYVNEQSGLEYHIRKSFVLWISKGANSVIFCLNNKHQIYVEGEPNAIIDWFYKDDYDFSCMYVNNVFMTTNEQN